MKLRESSGAITRLLLAVQEKLSLIATDVKALEDRVDCCLVDYLGDADKASLVRTALVEVKVPPPITPTTVSASHLPGPHLPGSTPALPSGLEGEALVPLPESCALSLPHAYECLGAPYGNVSPFQMRVSAVQRLAQAQVWLQQARPGYQLQIFDAYRPVSVQAFMVEYSLQQSLAAHNIEWAEYQSNPDAPQYTQLRRRVAEIWALPSPNPQTPPPHATGSAVDLTIVDETGKPLDMGCPIDHLGPESEANYYARIGQSTHPAQMNRCLLVECMAVAGFKRLPHEWWHFSYGDQWWALLDFLHTAQYGDDLSSSASEPRLQAHYGRYDAVST
jgi:D-alanyl-D-alanine dipeptidase